MKIDCGTDSRHQFLPPGAPKRHSGEGRNPEGRRGRRQGSYFGVQATIVVSDRCENTSPTLSQGNERSAGACPQQGKGVFWTALDWPEVVVKS